MTRLLTLLSSSSDSFSDHYLPLLDANDLLQDVSKKCIAAIGVLETFDNYWKNEKKNRLIASINLRSLEHEKQLRAVASVISFLDNIRQAWLLLEEEDFIRSTKLLIEIDSNFKLLDRNLTPPPLLSHIGDSIENLKKWFMIYASRISSDLQSNEHTVLAALSAVTVVAEHRSLEETLDLFLNASSFKVTAPSAGLDHVCCGLVKLVTFTCKVIYQAFLNERSDCTVPLLVKNNFSSYSVKHVDREIVLVKLQNWLLKQKSSLNEFLSPIFASGVQFAAIISTLISLERTISSVKNDWNHYTPLVCSSKLDVWREFFSLKFRPAIDESMDGLIKQCPLKLDESFPPTNVDMASFVWPTASNEASDSLEAFELRINGICPGYVSTSESTIQFIKSLANQCEDLHPEVPVVGAEESREIKKKLVDSFISHIKQSLETMKLQVTRNELLTLQAINMTRNIATRCKSLKILLELTDDTYKWLEVKSLLLQASSEWITSFIGNKIEIETTKCLKQIDLTGDWTDAQISLWEDVTIVDPSDNENKKSATIKVPIFTSPLLLELLYKISNHINRYFAHVMPESASQALFIKLSKELASLYGKLFTCLSQSDLSASIKHKQALQFSFDLTFLRLILSTYKDSQMKAIVSQVTSVNRSFETLVDPFDLHLISKNMQTNATQALKSHMQLVSLILPESCLTSLRQRQAPASSASKKWELG